MKNCITAEDLIPKSWREGTSLFFQVSVTWEIKPNKNEGDVYRETKKITNSGNLVNIYFKNCSQTVRFLFLTALIMKMRAFWDIAPWNLVGVDRRFSCAYCLIFFWNDLIFRTLILIIRFQVLSAVSMKIRNPKCLKWVIIYDFFVYK
jgi:hypothetical protein